MVCKEFYDGFLDNLDTDLRDRVTTAIHTFKDHDLEELSKIFEEIVLDIEKQLGLDSLEGHVVTDHLVLILNKREDGKGAIEFLERKLKRFGKDEFPVLVTLSTIHDKNGQYEEAIEILERANKVARSDFQLALCAMKLAADHWNFKSSSEEAYGGYQSEGMRLLRKIDSDPDALPSCPSTEEGLLYIHAYKTAAYLYRMQYNGRERKECYFKAINLMKKSPESKLQYLKTLTQLCLAEAQLCSDNDPILMVTVEGSIGQGHEIARELIEDGDFINAHPDTMTHILSRLARSYEILKKREDSLKLRLEALEILKEHMGLDHPETARLSSDIALNYYNIKKREECDEHIMLAEEILVECNYKEDIVKAKLYFREISDTLRNLGNLFSLMCEFGDAERQFLSSIELHKKVYGENHQRISRVYRYLANLYVKWEKKDKAIQNFNDAIRIQELYLPASQDLIAKIRKDLERATSNRKGKGGRGARGRASYY